MTEDPYARIAGDGEIVWLRCCHCGTALKHAQQVEGYGPDCAAWALENPEPANRKRAAALRTAEVRGDPAARWETLQAALRRGRR